MKNKQRSTEFKTLMDYAKEMHSRYFHTLSAFYAYEALCEITAPNIVGKYEAEENAKTIRRYNNFFLPARESLRVYFFLELAKMFDSSKQSLHINKILNFTESNITNLTLDAFKEYKGINYADLVSIKALLDNHEVALNKLDVYRNKWLAHDDINKPELPSINQGEIKNLFKILAKILNTITSQLNSESWTYSHIENDVKHHTRLVIDHLRRFEPYHIKEIDEKQEIPKR